MSLEESDREAGAVAKTTNRVTLADIEASVAEKHFVTGAEAIAIDGTGTSHREALEILTLCIVVTTSGFTLVGKSAPADPENFDADLGKKLAYEDVLKQLWPLMGFALREKLAAQ